jgi:DNA-directed RNA polymerase subunit RPC12/RpoP
MGLLESMASLFGISKPGADIWQNCPNCGERINLAMERCPKCGTHIDSMFRLKCPSCGHENQLRAKKCEKCNAPLVMPKKSEERVYVCPRCNFKANYRMTECPVCGVKFI